MNMNSVLKRFAIAAVTMLSACSSVTAPHDPDASQNAGLGAPMIVMAMSGPFSRPAQRSDEVPARLVVWDDGLVTANVGERLEPRFETVRLEPPKFAELRQLIESAELTSFTASSEAFGGCIDCPVVIVQIHINARNLEIAARGNVAQAEYRQITTYPSWYLELRQALSAIEHAVRESPNTVSITRDVPTVAVAPDSSG